MRTFDHDFVRQVVARLDRLAPDAKPAWGRLDSAGMISHLAQAVRFSMGRGGTLPDKSTWVRRRILGPLLMYRILPMPKNVQSSMTPVVVSDLEDLHALMEEYLHLVETGELTPPPHPFFGQIGIDGWARLHVIHFEHHMRQFGV